MYFNLKALEAISLKQLGSKAILILLFLLAIFLYFFKQMNFSNEHFYVRGEDHFLWGSLWMLFFLYWNFSYLFYFFKVKQKENRDFLIKSPLYSLNISFFLASIYSYSAGLLNNFFKLTSNEVSNICGGIFSNFEIVFDAPSIWCAFAAIQGFFLIRLWKKFHNIEDITVLEIENIKINKFFILFISLICVGIIFFTLPLFSALSYKMILK